MHRLLGLTLGFALAMLSARAGATEELQALRLTTIAGAGNVHLLVAETGEPHAPGILFIHGFAQSYLSFRHQYRSELAARFHLVAFDLRGHGGSAKPDNPADYDNSRVWADDVAAVIAATGLVRPVIVGWSYGGFVAMDYVRHYGTANVAGIDLVGSLGGLAASRNSSPATTTTARLMRDRSDAQRSMNLLDNITGGKATATSYVTQNMSPLDRDILFATEMLTPAYARRQMMARKLDNSDLARAIDIPVLLSRGSRDLTMPQDALGTVLRTLPDARLSVYPNTGHLIFVERSERFDQELAAFAEFVQAPKR